MSASEKPPVESFYPDITRLFDRTETPSPAQTNKPKNMTANGLSQDDWEEALSRAAETTVEGVISDKDADKYWRNLFQAKNIDDVTEQAIAKVVVVAYQIKNSTSTQQAFGATVRLGNKMVPMYEVMAAMGLPSSEFRRFMRAPSNVALLQDILRNSEAMRKPWEDKAQAAGLDVNMYRAVSDIFDDFTNKTQAECAAAAIIASKRARSGTIQQRLQRHEQQAEKERVEPHREDTSSVW